MARADRIRTAHVRRPHGVRGVVRVEPLGGTPERFAAGLRVTVDGDGRELTVQGAQGLPDGDLLLWFDEVTDRDAADALRDRYLTVPRSQARTLGVDEWFVDSVIGLRAVTLGGEEIGSVTELESYTASDVLVVQGKTGVRRFPMVKAFVHAVSPEAGTITITPWEEDQ